MRTDAGAWLASVALVVLGACVPLGFAGTLYWKERDDRFCVACHLHEEKFVRFQARPTPTDLAGAHHASRRAIRCIDCHGGADLGMRLRVWAVAGLDTLQFLAGRYQEPTRMRLPLRDADCEWCHDPIVPITGRAGEAPGARGDSYHEIPEHRTVKHPCVACHVSHGPGEPRLQFIDRGIVLPLCRSCHPAIGSDVSG